MLKIVLGIIKAYRVSIIIQSNELISTERIFHMYSRFYKAPRAEYLRHFFVLDTYFFVLYA